MMYLVGIFSILVAAAGWFYMFYSQAAHRLSGIEDAAANASRIRLRRVGGAVMILLAIAFYVACDALVHHRIALFSGLMLAVLAMLATSLVIALIDLRLTRKLREARRRRERKD